MTEPESYRDLSELFTDHRARSALLVAAYDAADARMRRSSELAVYTCGNPKRDCFLLVAWQAPGARLVRLPAYKLSATRNAKKTVAGARARNTSDGDRHWLPRVLLLDELDGWTNVGLDLRCDHVSEAVVGVADLLGEIRGVRPGNPVRRVVRGAVAGSRYRLQRAPGMDMPPAD